MKWEDHKHSSRLRKCIYRKWWKKKCIISFFTVSEKISFVKGILPEGNDSFNQNKFFKDVS